MMLATKVPVGPTPCPSGAKTFEHDQRGRLWVQWHLAGPAWSETLNKVKGLQDRQFDPQRKLWTCKDNLDNRARLLEWGFQLVASGQGSQAPENTAVPVRIGLPEAPAPREITPWTAPWLDIEIPDLGINLRPYQVEALQMLKYRKGSGGLFLDPGTGKTLTSFAWLKMNPDIRPAIVLTTASTKLQWPREAKKWGIQARHFVCSGMKATRIPANTEIVYCNHDILKAWVEEFMRLDPVAVICDESQAFGNTKSQRTKALFRLVKGRQFIPLSGTPIRTRPAQFWSILHLLDPDFCKGKEWTYLNRFCGPKSGFGGALKFDGATNIEELHEKVREVSIRKTKADVLKDLPDRVYIPVLMDCVVTEEYREAENKILTMQGHNPSLIRERLTALTASAYLLKEKAVLDWIADFLDNTEEKLVIFCWHKAVMDSIEMHLGRQCVRVSGGVSKEAKEAACQRFRKDASCRVFLGQIASAGVGIDGLQEVCSNMAFVELSWSPADLDQAESRLHRLGQRDSITIYHLLAAGTIDEVMEETVSGRMGTVTKIVDGKDIDEAETALTKLKALKGTR
jgi:SWI/SNF-related matrix-associated actin-dependent regulator 1 of chromatin subfamily A